METKFTPGPWRIDGPDCFGDFNILHDGDSLAVAAVVSNMRYADEIAGNAHLIAAAPELYAALADMTELLERVGDSRKDAPFIDAANAALAKARGETS